MLGESLTNANHVFSFQMVVACGTEDVLTCHVILMRESRTGVTAIAHFDEFSRHWDVSGLMEDFLTLEVVRKSSISFEKQTRHSINGDSCPTNRSTPCPLRATRPGGRRRRRRQGCGATC